jgi:hypothetical protein
MTKIVYETSQFQENKRMLLEKKALRGTFGYATQEKAQKWSELQKELQNLYFSC